jgi:hypothetical protein
MRLARCALQLRPQINREPEGKAHSGIIATRFHVAMISQRYHLRERVPATRGPYLVVDGNQIRGHHRAPTERRAFPWTTAYRSPASVTRSVPRRTWSGTTMKPAWELRIRSYARRGSSGVPGQAARPHSHSTSIDAASVMLQARSLASRASSRSPDVVRRMGVVVTDGLPSSKRFPLKEGPLRAPPVPGRTERGGARRRTALSASSTLAPMGSFFANLLRHAHARCAVWLAGVRSLRETARRDACCPQPGHRARGLR